MLPWKGGEVMEGRRENRADGGAESDRVEGDGGGGRGLPEV